MSPHWRFLAIAGLLVSACPALAQPAPRFDIAGFQVDGDSLLGPSRLKEVLAPFSGRSRDFADVQRALEAVEAAYAGAGWGGVQVVLPEQRLEDGIVRIRVIESRVSGIGIEGAQHFTAANVRAAAPGLQVGQSPRLREVQESLRLANENPAKQTTLVLRAGAQEGEIDAVLRVADRPPRRVALSLDNSGNSQTGDYRVGLAYMDANVLERDHVFNAQVITSPTRTERVLVAGLGYRLPFYGLGDSLELATGYSNVDSGVVQDLFVVRGAGSVHMARYNMNFPRWRGWEPKLSFGLDYRAYRNRAELLGSGARLLPDVTVKPASLGFSVVARRARSETAATLGVARNLPGGDLGDGPAFEAVRQGANPHYTLWRWGVSHTASVAGDWQWRAALNGQWTRDALVPGEQYGLGGAASVRGFRDREVSSDRGHQGTLELLTPELASGASGLRLRALAFYDFGQVRRNHALPGEMLVEGISSYGLGLRAAWSEQASLRLDYGVVAQPGGSQGHGDGRLSASLIYQF